jgi:hypothetical protein
MKPIIRSAFIMNNPATWMTLALTAGALGLVGCALTQPRNAGTANGLLLFNAAGGTSWRNHVTPVPNPAGSGDVLQAERVERHRFQMSFIQKDGFFVMPDPLRGAVRLRLLVQREGRIRVALVSGAKIKSYYQSPPVTNQWFEMTLPLAEAAGRLAPGDRINDITLWLGQAAEGQTLAPDAQFYFDEARLLAELP